MTPFSDTEPGRRFFSRPYRPAAPCGVALLLGVLPVAHAAADDTAPDWLDRRHTRGRLPQIDSLAAP